MSPTTKPGRNKPARKLLIIAAVMVVAVPLAAAENPCAAKNPLNPCAPGHIKAPDADLSLNPAAAEKVYRRLRKDMAAAFAMSGKTATKRYQSWRRYNKAPYQSTQHGDRYLNNYANKTAQAYGKFEQSGKLLFGSVLAKDSFTVLKDGGKLPGPIFIMEKMKAGFRPDFGDWRYSMILPDGSFVGQTGGEGAENVEYCGTCHARVPPAHDHMFYLPKKDRVGAN